MKETTEQILRSRFPETQYALLEEVSDKAGFSRSRSADFILVGLWPSRGLHVTGIERKSWRNDWLNELKKPEKQENHFRFCDFFYLLTDNEGVAKPEEIPVPWGWMHIDMKGKLKVMKEAPKHIPQPITPHFLAAMLKRATDKRGWIRTEDIEDRLKKEREFGQLEIRNERSYESKALKELKDVVKIFEDQTGIKIGSTYDWQWGDTKKLGEWVKFLMHNDPNKLISQIENIKNQAKRIVEETEKGLSLCVEKDG